MNEKRITFAAQKGKMTSLAESSLDVLQIKKQVTAGVAQLVEHNLAKVGVASPSLVSRSYKVARMAELVDAQDLKSCCQE